MAILGGWGFLSSEVPLYDDLGPDPRRISSYTTSESLAWVRPHTLGLKPCCVISLHPQLCNLNVKPSWVIMVT